MPTKQCPACNLPNDSKAPECAFCGSRLFLVPTSSDSPQALVKVGLFVLGALIPPIGMLWYAVTRKQSPEIARPTGAGTLLGSAVWAVFVVLPAVLMARVISGDQPSGEQEAMEILRDGSLDDMKQAETLLTFYSRDHHGYLPALTSTAVVKKDTAKYLPKLHSSDTANPFDNVMGGSFLVNAAYSGKLRSSIGNPAKVAQIYEDSDSNEKRAVGFVDGHAALVAPRDWPTIAKRSGITIKP